MATLHIAVFSPLLLILVSHVPFNDDVVTLKRQVWKRELLLVLHN